MRLPDIVARDDLARLSVRFPGLEPDRVVVRPLPAGVTALFPGLGGMALGRSIWVHGAALAGHDLSPLIVHELAHVMQWRRHGPLGFLLRYGTDYLRGRLGGLDHAGAYRSIAAEAEARQAVMAFEAERPD